MAFKVDFVASHMIATRWHADFLFERSPSCRGSCSHLRLTTDLCSHVLQNVDNLSCPKGNHQHNINCQVLPDAPLEHPNWLQATAPGAAVHSTVLKLFDRFQDNGKGLAEILRSVTGVYVFVTHQQKGKSLPPAVAMAVAAPSLANVHDAFRSSIRPYSRGSNCPQSLEFASAAYSCKSAATTSCNKPCCMLCSAWHYISFSVSGLNHELLQPSACICLPSRHSEHRDDSRAVKAFLSRSSISVICTELLPFQVAPLLGASLVRATVLAAL